MHSKKSIKIAAVQIEMEEDNKAANLEKMSHFIDDAASRGTDIVSFPELCTTGYHYLCTSSKTELLKIAEPLDGDTFQYFHAKAIERGITILFGMLELSENDKMYNSYLVVTPEGLHFRYRKVHAFENSAILQGDTLDTFDLYGWTCGILICYDNNLPENTRVLALKGAQIVFAPHQTGGFDIERAGMGRIPLEYWQNRHIDPLPMRQAIIGPKGYQWITKWLPSRSYDNNVFTIFANGVGIDGPEVRVGCSMIIDPEGIILAETTIAEDDLIDSIIDKRSLENTLASSHMMARRPSLYGKISEAAVEINTREVRNMMSGETIR